MSINGSFFFSVKVYLGKTTGRGKNDHTYKPNRSIKAVWGYPLSRDFRVRLCEARG